MEVYSGIKVEHIYKSFGKDTVLQDVSLSIEPGQIFGVVGNNGSGKTVLMKCICGFLRPDKGKIMVNGQQVGKDCDFPDSMGLIIETPGFIPNLSGFQNLKILAALKGKIGRKEIKESILRVGLDPAMGKPVAKYSLGMRQRLGIAQAIMEDPDVLILDEPFNGLDKAGVAHMRELVKELKSQGKSILLASHNVQDIEELCDVVHEMEEKWNENT
ncbi:MAG: ATP-binding cassette domain-containing protein [Lachnospiraceae bacterium]|nr:ATP-binding cassette domain-containing protein [Lachnospiraceae bacterium]